MSFNPVICVELAKSSASARRSVLIPHLYRYLRQSCFVQFCFWFLQNVLGTILHENRYLYLLSE